MNFFQMIAFSASAFAEESIEGQAFSNMDSPMMGMNGYNEGMMMHNPAMMNAVMNGGMMNGGMMNQNMMAGVNGYPNTGVMNNPMMMNSLSIPPMNHVPGGLSSATNTNGGSLRSSSGSHNEGSTYSNQSAWDRGYNNTDSKTFSIGQYDNEDSDMFNQFGSNNNRMMGYGRRLDASSSSILDSLFENGAVATFAPEDEPIDGQAFRRNAVLNQYPPTSTRMESQLLRGNPVVNPGNVAPSLIRSVLSPILGNNGVANTSTNRSKGSNLASNGMYNGGSTYANSSGWDRGYNNTESQAFTNGRSAVSSRDLTNRAASSGSANSHIGNVLGGILGPMF